MTLVVAAPHVTLDADGTAWIAGTTFKVRELVVEHLAHGWSPEEIHFQHGGAISMAQIHGALSWYYDHQHEIDAEIDGDVRYADTLRARLGPSTLRARLKPGSDRA